MAAMLDLLVDAWRLERWVAQTDAGASTAAVRFVSRRLSGFFDRFGLQAVDVTGQRYEPGLAVELVGNVIDDTLGRDMVLIGETVAPLCLLRGKVVRLGQVVTRSSPTASGAAS